MSPSKFANRKIAFVKYGGLAAGGTEKFLQEIAMELVRLGFQIDYFYCDPRISPGSTWIHPPNDKLRENRLLSAGVKLRKFRVGYKDLSRSDHYWVSSDFFEVFDEKKYTMVWTAKAGPKEFPFYLINLPFVEVVTLDAGFDVSQNRIYSILISNWQRNTWIRQGGNEQSSSILPLPVASIDHSENYRAELGIHQDAVVVGFHQRVDDAIASPIPLEAFSALRKKESIFLIMGGGAKYQQIADVLKVPTIFLPHNSNENAISKFLNTLDVYAHGRSDGETFGTVLAEAMIHGLPIVTHKSTYGANAHSETIANGGFFAFSKDEYSNILGELVGNAELRSEVGQRGREFAHSAYSHNAFKENLQKILGNIGLLDSPKERKNQSTTKTIAAQIMPGTRVLIHDLPEEKIHQAKRLAKRTETFTLLIHDLRLTNPQTICARGFESFLIAINIGRGLTKAKIVCDPITSEDRRVSKLLLEMNGLMDYEVDTRKELSSSQHGEVLELLYDPSPFEVAETFKSRFFDFLRSKRIRRFKLLLFAPIESDGEVRMGKQKIAIERQCFISLLCQVALFTRNIAFIFKSIARIYARRIKSRKSYRRLLHLKFLILQSKRLKG